MNEPQSFEQLFQEAVEFAKTHGGGFPTNGLVQFTCFHNDNWMVELAARNGPSYRGTGLTPMAALSNALSATSAAKKAV